VTLFPHSGARPSFPFKYGNRTNAKEPWGPQPSTLYLASDRLRPESWPRKKKLEQFSSVRLELKSPNLLITKAFFNSFQVIKKLFLPFYDLATLADPFSPPFRWIAPISEPFLSFGELFLIGRISTEWRDSALCVKVGINEFFNSPSDIFLQMGR
jgi:hypothetical protein